MANMTLWEPKRDLLSLRDAMDQLFEESFVRPLGTLFPSRVQGESMPVDMVENDDTIVVKAAVPGMKAEDLEITVVGGVLTIKAENKESTEETKGNYIYREWKSGSVVRALTLPTEVDIDKATAEMVDGVLTLSLPKAEEVRPQRLTIKTK